MKTICTFFCLVSLTCCENKNIGKFDLDKIFLFKILNIKYGEPSQTYIKNFSGQESVRLLVAAYQKPIDLNDMHELKYYQLYRKSTDDDLSAEWINSSIWVDFKNHNKNVEKIITDSLNEMWIIGSNNDPKNYERFLLCNRGGQSFVFFESYN